MSEYNKILNRDSSVSNLDSKDYPDDHDSITLSTQENQENQVRNQDNQGQQSSNQANQDKIKVQTFKQTEVGLIPEDWEVSRLGQIANFYNGKAHEQSIAEHGDYFVVNSKFISTEGKVFKNSKENICPLEKGTIVMVMSDIPNGKALAKCFMIPKDGKYTLNQRICAIKSDIVINEFLIRKLNRNDFYLAFDSGTGQTNLKKDDVLNCPVAYPALRSEQKAIAQVLSDTDALIQTLEQKLAKKRAIKQGAMQQLLTPKEDWMIKKLGEIAHFYNGKAHEKYIDAYGEFTVINSKFVSTSGNVSKNSTVNLSPLKKGDITMVMSDIPNGKALAKCFIVPIDNKYALNQRICAIRAETVDNDFLYLILNRNEYYLAFDSGTGQTNLKKNDVLECPIPLPRTKSEQIQIANILFDMDAEIAHLEQKLDKYKLLKQGLMQELLTGRIRLL